MLQVEVDLIQAIATSHDVFGVLPTGYGESLCFAW